MTSASHKLMGASATMKSRPIKGPLSPPWGSPIARCPIFSDMPICITMVCATCVHCWKSLEAPVVTLSAQLMISSDIRHTTF